MSRRASLLAKQEKRKPRVRFPDELVFLDNIKGNDIQACHSMLRRASVQLDINGLDASGLTPLHNAVLEGNLAAVKLLVQHGADVNKKDIDTWTPLHAACANGEADIARYLLSKGASKDLKTNDGERPLDLCDARDFSVISVMLESEASRKAKLKDAKEDDFLGSEEDEANNNSEDDLDGGRHSGSSDASPEPPRRSTARADAKNANVKPGSSSGLVKALGSLKTVLEDNVSGDLPSPDGTALSSADPFARATDNSRCPEVHNSPASRAPASILKKSK